MPEIEIRAANLTELSALLKMDHSYQTTHVWQMDRSVEKGQISIYFREVRLPRPVRVSYPNQPENITAELSKAGNLLIAVMNETAVGYIQVREIQNTDTGWISNLAVVEELRRKGIGGALVLAVQNWASKRGLRRVVLEMQSKNYPAIQLANKLGYEFSGYNDHYFENRDIALFFSSFLR
jgi:ribosomal protein S18 acetylase RimI-like enzyme